MSLNGAMLSRYADYLPGAARELIGVVGESAAAKIIDAYQGRVIQVAKGKRVRGVKQLQGLAEVAGKIAADKLCRHYGGGFLRVPQCKAVMRMIRDASLQARFDALTASGQNARPAVAILVGEFGPIDESTVWEILKRPLGDMAAPIKATDDRQAGLF